MVQRIAPPKPSPIDQVVDALEYLYSRQDETEGLRRLAALDEPALVIVGRLLIHRSVCCRSDSDCYVDRCTAIEEAAECYALHGPDPELRERLAEWDRAGLHPEGERHCFRLEIGGVFVHGIENPAAIEEWEDFEATLPAEQRVDVRAEVARLRRRPTPEELATIGGGR